MTALDIHEASLHHKTAHAHVTDVGEEVEEHTLYRYECSCGWAGAYWYASRERARGHFERHVPTGAESSVGPGGLPDVKAAKETRR